MHLLSISSSLSQWFSFFLYCGLHPPLSSGLREREREREREKQERERAKERRNRKDPDSEVIDGRSCFWGRREWEFASPLKRRVSCVFSRESRFPCPSSDQSSACLIHLHPLHLLTAHVSIWPLFPLFSSSALSLSLSLSLSPSQCLCSFPCLDDAIRAMVVHRTWHFDLRSEPALVLLTALSAFVFFLASPS